MSTKTQSGSMVVGPPFTQEAPVESEAIRPFSVNVPEEEIEDLPRRIAATRWRDRETVIDRSQGVQLAKFMPLVDHRCTDYDWRKVEATLNALPQFITEIDGLDLQFSHIRSPHHDALPLLMTHGWPGSILELLNVIEPLTNPTAHGGGPEAAFHLVLPTMPGYGFSGNPTSTGWSPARMASAFPELMLRLGYPKYVSQGGDWGAIISQLLAVQVPEGLLGIHVNMPGTVPSDVLRHLRNFDPAPEELSDREEFAYDRPLHFYHDGFGYAAMMNQSPQTIGYALADSPVGLAAYYYDKFAEWTDSGGEPEKELTFDEMSMRSRSTGSPPPVRRRRGRTGRVRRRAAARSMPSTPHLFRSPSRCFRPKSTRRRGAGENWLLATSSTGTRSTEVATSLPGNSRNCSAPRSGRHSAPCVDRSS